MKGAFFLGNREFEVRDMEKRPLAADEVRIRVIQMSTFTTARRARPK